MALKIKRLSMCRDHYPFVRQLMRANSTAWEEQLRWWRDIGINTAILRVVLANAGSERNEYEEKLRARVDSLTRWQIRRAKHALKRAQPLMQLLRTTPALDGPLDLFFGDLADQIERAVKKYIDTRRPSLDPHRPRDPWLRKIVLLLAQVLGACEHARERIPRKIYEILTLAGHGDLVTLNQIRHIIREARERNPQFGGSTSAECARLKRWFTEEHRAAHRDKFA
jgi:hypothetical protein